jgi:predicted acetyltransferase
MSSTIRRLTERDLGAFAAIIGGAYPGMVVTLDESVERLRRSLHEASHTALYGLFRAGRLLGGMCHFDFQMAYHGLPIAVGGVGMVAVDLLHKKEQVARELITFFLRHYRNRGTAFAALYPFRPDFYRRMGFGYGTRLNHHRFAPTSLPAGRSRVGLRPLHSDDAEQVLRCYNHYAARTHGMFQHNGAWARRLFENTELRMIGSFTGDELRGFMAYRFVREGNWLTNSIEVRELICESRDALDGFLAFLRSQADQVATVVINTQDDQFHYVLSDPRNGSDTIYPSVYHETSRQGLGIMYRVLDTAGAFRTLAGHRFGGTGLTLAIDLADSFLPENAGTTIVHFQNGRGILTPDAEPQVRISLAIEDFSSLLIGAVDFQSLYRYRLAEIDNPDYIDTIQHLFYSPARPVCTTPF